jgi:hypothetical protein
MVGNEKKKQMKDRYKDILEDTQEQNENVEQMQDDSNIIPDPTAPIDFNKSSNGTAPTSPTFDDKTSEDINNMNFGMSMGNVIFKNQGASVEDPEKLTRSEVKKQKDHHKSAHGNLDFGQYVKVNKETGGSQTKRFIPKINLPEVNLPSVNIDLTKKPKAKYGIQKGRKGFQQKRR